MSKQHERQTEFGTLVMGKGTTEQDMALFTEALRVLQGKPLMSVLSVMVNLCCRLLLDMAEDDKSTALALAEQFHKDLVRTIEINIDGGVQ